MHIYYETKVKQFFLTIFFHVQIIMRKFLICILLVVLYTISCFITILCTLLTSTACHETFKESYQSCALHSTCSLCHRNSHCIISICTKTLIVIGMLIASLMNKRISRHFQALFQAFECTMSSLGTNDLSYRQCQNRQHADRPHKMTRREDTDNATSS